MLNDALSPNNQGGWIVLATPTFTNNPLENTFYQQYLYAAVENGNGTLVGLYLTKDAGNNWTVVNLVGVPQHRSSGVDSQFYLDGYGTNNTNEQPRSSRSRPLTQAFHLPQGNYDISLAIDPTNPNIVYLGGTDTTFSIGGEQIAANSPSSGLIRIDTTDLFDAYSEVGYLNNKPGGNVNQYSPLPDR